MVYIRTESSHDLWDYPADSGKQLLRKVTIRSKYKEIPPRHIFTNLITMEIDYETFDEEIKNI